MLKLASHLSSRAMTRARVFYLSKPFKGEPTADNFEIKESELRPLKDGEFLVEAEWLSVDPYMRAYLQGRPAGIPMIGSQVARVIESKSKEYAVGEHVMSYWGWASHTIVDPNAKLHGELLRDSVTKVKHTDMPLSYALGVLGMPGATAYFGLLELCQPKAGETVVVSGAAGAVGCLVGQIAKIKGCNVIGFAGTDDKVEWLKKTCKFDHAFNYKKMDISKALTEAAPNGVDCYFDNVGGSFSSVVLYKMNRFGRIAVCGSISSYNQDGGGLPQATIVQPGMVFKELKMEGFVVSRWAARFPEAIQQIYSWIKEGKIVYKEHITEGFSNMPKAFIGMLNGENTGKAVVKA